MFLNLLILVSLNVTLFGNQAVAEDMSATFSCTAPPEEKIARYIWKLDGSPLIKNISQYTNSLNRDNDGQILSCAAVTFGGVISQEPNFTLQVYCK